MVPSVALRSRRDRLDEQTRAVKEARMEAHLRIGVDVGCHAHRVGIANSDGTILEEFDISHSKAGFAEFFRRRSSGSTIGFCAETGHSR